ncbi:MAG: hypothetical protein ACREI3_02620 [Nitrospirales bacterium]
MASARKGLGLVVIYKALNDKDRNVSGATHPISGAGNVKGDYETTFHIALLTMRLQF